MGRSLALSVPDIQYPGAGTPKLNQLSGLLQLSCKQPSVLGGHGGASLYLKVKELPLRDEGAVRSPQVLKNQTASLQARSTVLCYPPA